MVVREILQRGQEPFCLYHSTVHFVEWVHLGWQCISCPCKLSRTPVSRECNNVLVSL